MKSKTYTQSKRPLDKNQSSKFCQSGVKQTHFQNLKEKRKWFFWSQGHFNSVRCHLYLLALTLLANSPCRISPKPLSLRMVYDKMIYEMNFILNCGYEIKWSYDPRSYKRNSSNRPFYRYGGHFDLYHFERHYGMPGGQINMYLPPGHPIMAIRNNRNQNGRRIGKKVYYHSFTRYAWSVTNISIPRPKHTLSYKCLSCELCSSHEKFDVYPRLNLLHVLSVWGRRIERVARSKYSSSNLIESNVGLIINFVLFSSCHVNFDVWPGPKIPDTVTF